MCEKNLDDGSFSEEWIKNEYLLLDLEKSFENRQVILKNQLNNQNSKINSIEHDLNFLNEVSEKTKEYLLLKLESNLDNQKLIQKNIEEKMDLLFKEANLINNEAYLENILLIFNNLMTNFKDILNEKDNVISGYNKIIESKDNKINVLNKKINDIEEKYDADTEQLNKRISLLISESNELNNAINMLNDENKMLSDMIKNKENDIVSIKETNLK